MCGIDDPSGTARVALPGAGDEGASLGDEMSEDWTKVGALQPVNPPKSPSSALSNGGSPGM
jgi:hypothetical protein